MKMTGKRFDGLLPARSLVVAALCLSLALPAWAQDEQAEASEDAAIVVAPEMSTKSYASLTGLVAMICGDAIAQFDGFFEVAPVTIEPFMVLGEFSAREKITFLGATLADQMAAVISNESLAVWRAAEEGEYEQRVSGLLQEVDGYLRVHITGSNTRGERRSYVVNVEMSEPIYRALHSYIYVSK